jgi:acyl-CoA synthetase (AMP-forming)/AMP-acid ligase II
MNLPNAERPFLNAVRCIADIPRYHARHTPDAVALRFGDRQTTYRELDDFSNRVANGLIAHGVGPGDRVAVLDKNCDSFFEIYFGATKAGAVLVPINYRLVAAEIAFVINDARAKIVFVDDSFVPVIAEIHDQLHAVDLIVMTNDSFSSWRDSQSGKDPGLEGAQDEVCMQLYTSGTTGLPKGVELTNHNFLSSVPGLLEAAGNLTSDDTFLVVVPLFHVAGVGSATVTLLAGLKTVIAREFTPAGFLAAVSRERITVTLLVPAMIKATLADESIEHADLSSLRIVCYGASPIAADLLRSAMDRFRHSGFVQFYGMTETTGAIVALSPQDHKRADSEIMASCGRGILGVEIRVVDESGNSCGPRQVGEIVCRTAQNMKGYWKRPADTAAAKKGDWLHTGDVGYFDESGYLYIRDRLKDVIISGGENIFSAEIESVILRHPDVVDVAVLGVPDERWGEAVKALVVLKDDAQAEAADLLRHARAQLAAYKIPKSIDFVSVLPRGAAGKILKRELREKYWQGHERRIN